MDATTSNAAVYDSAPLDNPRTQIRILRSVSHEPAADSKYEFVVCDLSSPPPYEAISYTWGDAAQRSTIYVNNLPLSVNSNCSYALWQARQSGSVCIWIDFVCIDQQNLQEKGAQVASMWTIFNSASLVLVCVGSPDEASDVVYEAVLDISDFIAKTSIELAGAGVSPNTTGDPFDELYFDKDEQEDWALGKGVEYCTALCEAYNKFSQRPYFSRLWVIQELHAGGAGLRIMFGVHRASWTSLKQLDRALLTTFRDGKDFRESPLFEGHANPETKISHLRQCFNGAQNGFLGHIEWIMDLLCHDRRDYVYGTLIFFDWERAGVPKIEPNYSITAFELAVTLGSISKRSGVDDLYRFCDILQVLDITAHDSLLVPYLRFNSVSRPQLQGESHRWTVSMLYLCTIVKTRKLDDQDVLADYASGDDPSPQASTNTQRSQPSRLASTALRNQCEAVLRNHEIAEGYGWLRRNARARQPSGIQDYLALRVPALAATGDIVIGFSTYQTSVYLVLRMAPELQQVSVVGKACRLGRLEGLERQYPHTEPNWNSANVEMEATVEEMISLMVTPCSLDWGIGPFAFPVPKIVSVTTEKHKRKRDTDTYSVTQIGTYSITEELMPSTARDSDISDTDELKDTAESMDTGESMDTDEWEDTDASEDTDESEREEVAA